MATNITAIEEAVAAGKLLEISAANLRRTLESATSPVATKAITELMDSGEWTELNDRFYRSLAFGTGDRAEMVALVMRAGIIR